MDWKDTLSALADELPRDPEEPQQETTEGPEPAPADKPQKLSLVYERKGRKGKPATIIVGFDWPDDRIAALLSQLQKRLGIGGSSRGGEILLQGDCRDRVAPLLRSLGHQVKLIVVAVSVLFACCAGSSTTAVEKSSTVSAVLAQDDICSDTVDVNHDKLDVDENTHFVDYEIYPMFPGGDAALLKWIGKHLRYPQAAKKKGIEGRVVVQFLITKDGSIGEAKVVRSKDPDLDKEALRLVKSLPKFTPGGYINPDSYKVELKDLWYTLPITFKLKTESNSTTNQNTDKL